HVRVHADVRRRPQFHARRADRARARRSGDGAMSPLTRSIAWTVGAVSVLTASVLLVSGQGPKPGDPLPGITPAEVIEFRLGLDDFTEVETIEDGLGPAFNATSCAVCHNVPAIGGTSLILETRAAYRDGSGGVRALNDAGDTLIHLFSVPSHSCQRSEERRV